MYITSQLTSVNRFKRLYTCLSTKLLSHFVLVDKTRVKGESEVGCRRGCRRNLPPAKSVTRYHYYFRVHRSFPVSRNLTCHVALLWSCQQRIGGNLGLNMVPLYYELPENRPL